MSVMHFSYLIDDWYEYSYLFMFFFFKQKTAYEMRISDWSSDVCSSDLLLRVGADARADDRQADPDHPRQTARRHAASDARGEAVAVGPQAQILSVRQAAPILPRSAHGISKIGRASCRERVCQYV